MDQTKGIGLGVPPDMKPGGAEAFWVYFGKEGGWHLRSTVPQSGLSSFSGRVWISAGKITDSAAFRIEQKDRVRTTVKAIEFDFDTSGNIDGFDFKVDGNECVSFKLLHQGKLADPKLINIGAKQVHPTSAIFTLCR